MSFSRSFHSTALRRYVLKKPKFDVRGIVGKIPEYKTSILNREMVNSKALLASLDELPTKYFDYLTLTKNLTILQNKRHTLEESAKNDTVAFDNLRPQLLEMKNLHHKLQSQIKELDDELTDVCKDLPNLMDPIAPTNEAVLTSWLNPTDKYTIDKELDHVNIMIKKNMINFEAGTNISGPFWYFLLNDGAELERALISYALDKVKAAGFKFCLPPSIVKDDIIDACGFRPRDIGDERQIYHIEDSNLGLTATAEIPLAGMFSNSTINLQNGPLNYVGLSRSYRAEAGAAGRSGRGLYRVHEFTKLEMFSWTKPEDSKAQFDFIKDIQCDIIRSLGLSAKVLRMPGNDLGASAYKKCDIEAWMPGKGRFGELTSVSNCLDYQSRRLHIKYKNEETGKTDYVHTLNGTAMAVPRVIVAIVENYYDKASNKIDIPTALRPYMNNKSSI